MKNFQFTIHYTQEFNYRLMHTIIGTTIFFFTIYTYKQSLIFILLPKGLSHFITTGVTEIFFAYIQLCTSISTTICITILLTQLLLFLRPGLYIYEANACFTLLITTIFFNTFLYTIAFPSIIQTFWKTFYTYSTVFMPIHLTFEPKFNDYITHLKQFNVILTCSLPAAILLGFIERNTTASLWIKHRGINYITSLVFAAFVTPPDIISQLFIGLPLIFIYEILVLYKTFKDLYIKKLLIWQPIKTQKYAYRKNKKRQ
uniref:Sec-independent protein translocase-like protein n=2 Tax=Sargassum TaxID=3015 RepID=A0A8K1YNV2_9PHAE|nr:SecY-independent protein translocase component tatC [Sargassum muticum]YP_010381305.1 sec-independent protein translocase-like protein [Sargassum kjellmanianum]UVW81837.1 SecY-independent protein translocase component tatC [Sargassum siliquastrum]AIE46222.1 SecY-independent protein translocase component tatC [Sargassum muticum]UDH59690.1 sec-independent protein translocase-like protein [Sargassum kjellmanianum]UQV81221.1 SecY-independent protein translocase component tatC [Sargassum muticum